MSFLAGILAGKDYWDAPPPRQTAPPPRSFAKALERGGGVIGEFKRATPSRRFELSYTPEEVVAMYMRAGVAALSVVVDRPHFDTTFDDLERMRLTASIPILAKGFFFHHDQLEAVRSYGADAVLLIVRILDQPALSSLLTHARELGMEAVVEIFSQDELNLVEDLDIDVLLVNNRDLDQLRLDLDRGEATLRAAVARGTGRLRVIASGLEGSGDITRFKNAGADGFLIGGALLAAPSPEAAARTMVEAALL